MLMTWHRSCYTGKFNHRTQQVWQGLSLIEWLTIQIFYCMLQYLNKEYAIKLLDIPKFECMPGTLELAIDKTKLLKNTFRQILFTLLISLLVFEGPVSWWCTFRLFLQFTERFWSNGNSSANITFVIAPGQLETSNVHFDQFSDLCTRISKRKKKVQKDTNSCHFDVYQTKALRDLQRKTLCTLALFVFAFISFILTFLNTSSSWNKVNHTCDGVWITDLISVDFKDFICCVL